MHNYIKDAVRAVLEITREVEEWREDYDPSTQEWYTLLNLAETADRLVYALPAEMFPDEEVRTSSEVEEVTTDQLMKALGVDW